MLKYESGCVDVAASGNVSLDKTQIRVLMTAFEAIQDILQINNCVEPQFDAKSAAFCRLFILIMGEKLMV